MAHEKRLLNMKTNNQRIDCMKGVVKPDVLKDQIRACVAGNGNGAGYLKGAIQYLGRFPPNPHIVPVLRRALEMSP